MKELREMMTGRNVVPITRETFPIGTPVIVRGFIDSNCGWDFSAPLHFMEPFHLSSEISSISDDVVEGRIIDLLVDLSCGDVIQPDDEPWPYTAKYIKRLWSRGKKGLVKRLAIYESVVTLIDWGDIDTGLDFTIVSKELSFG